MKHTMNELLLGGIELQESINSMLIKLRLHEIKTGKENTEQRESLKLLQNSADKYSALCGTALVSQARCVHAMETVLAQTERIRELEKELETEKGINSL